MNKKIVLAVMDGVGLREEKKGNAVVAAHMNNLEELMRKYGCARLNASGEAVGLPRGRFGNSEVGHLTIGAGRVVLQPLEVIDRSIADGSFFRNAVLVDAIDTAIKNDSALHVVGLLSDGGVHSHISHIKSILDLAYQKGLTKVYLHAFLDGRDTFPKVCMKYLDYISFYLDMYGYKLASMMGRFYGMDREREWDRTKEAYDAIVGAKGDIATSYKEVINSCYDREIYDEFIPPYIFSNPGVSDNDVVIGANFRPDRMVQLFSALSNPKFEEFNTIKFSNLKVVTLMEVNETVISEVAFPRNIVHDTLGEVLSNYNQKVLRIAEVSKFPHVTHFFDGDKDVDFKGTDKVCLPRVDVATYDLAPEMNSSLVTRELIFRMDDYDFILVNYPNGDMVGHTGNFDAAVSGLKCVDSCLKKLYDACLEKDFTLIITADHGNCDEMVDNDGNILTTHSTSLVPFIVCDDNVRVSDGNLTDVAVSILSYLDYDVPSSMTGNNIIKKLSS